MVSALEINAPDILVRTLTPSWMLGIFTDSNGQKSAFVIVTTNFFQNAFAGMLQWESVMSDDLKQYLFANVPQGVANAQPISIPKAIIDPLSNIDSILPTTSVFSTTTSTSSRTQQGTSTKASGSLSETTVTNATSTKNSATLASSTMTFGTSTASTTIEPALKPYFTIRGTFQDRIIQNKDVREFKTSDGTVLFLYSFIDNTKLVVTGNENTLTEILSRLEKQSFMR
jgi:hypothetical protein